MVISEKYTDLAGKFRVVVQINNNTRAIPLVFETEVNDATILAKVQDILDAEAAQEELDGWITIELSL